MSNDMKLFLKLCGSLAAIAVVVGGIVIATSQLRARREQKLQAEIAYAERQSREGWVLQSQQARLHEQERLSGARAKAPSQPPQRSIPIQSVVLRHLAFSPDGRFLAAVAVGQSVGELVIW